MEYLLLEKALKEHLIEVEEVDSEGSVRELWGRCNAVKGSDARNHFKRWYFHVKKCQRIVDATELAKKPL